MTASSLSFPITYVGDTSRLPLVEILTNRGTSPVHISEIDVLGSNASEFGSSAFSIPNGCTTIGMVLAPQAICTIEVSFSPASAGQKMAALQIVSDAPNPLIRIPLSGQGVAFTSSAFSITGDDGAPLTSLTFTKAGVPQRFIVTNTGTGVLSLTMNLSSTSGTLVQGTINCSIPSVTLGPGGSCFYEALLNALVPGEATGSIAINAMVGSSRVTQTVTVDIPASGVNFSAAPVSFGEWGIALNGNPATTSTPLTISVMAGDKTPSVVSSFYDQRDQCI